MPLFLQSQISKCLVFLFLNTFSSQQLVLCLLLCSEETVHEQMWCGGGKNLLSQMLCFLKMSVNESPVRAVIESDVIVLFRSHVVVWGVFKHQFLPERLISVGWIITLHQLGSVADKGVSCTSSFMAAGRVCRGTWWTNVYHVFWFTIYAHTHTAAAMPGPLGAI